MKVVIVGCGRVGAFLANLLSQDGHEVSVIDKEEGSFSRLGKGSKARPVLGVGIDLDVLREAGIEQANAFAAVTNGDNTNYMASRLAKEVFSVPTVVARLYDPNRIPLFKKVGIPIMCSTIVGARAMRELITRGSIASHLLVDGTFMAEEFLVKDENAGKTLLEIGKDLGAKVVALLRGAEVLDAKPEDPVHTGDVLLCVQQAGSLLSR
jgi:trk system potassium uptake protein TrkA